VTKRKKRKEKKRKEEKRKGTAKRYVVRVELKEFLTSFQINGFRKSFGVPKLEVYRGAICTGKVLLLKKLFDEKKSVVLRSSPICLDRDSPGPIEPISMGIVVDHDRFRIFKFGKVLLDEFVEIFGDPGAFSPLDVAVIFIKDSQNWGKGFHPRRSGGR